MNVDKDRGEMKRDEGRDEDYYQRKISIISEKDVDIIHYTTYTYYQLF